MLIGGRRWINASFGYEWLNSPEFFSLNPTLAPLPSCLQGTKTPIDNQERQRAALIRTLGKI